MKIIVFVLFFPFLFQSGYTALMYSVMLNQPTILSALLRRGADPNVEVQQEVQSAYRQFLYITRWEKSWNSNFIHRYLQKNYTYNDENSD